MILALCLPLLGETIHCKQNAEGDSQLSRNSVFGPHSRVPNVQPFLTGSRIKRYENQMINIKQINESSILGLPRGKRAVNSIGFICPTWRCKVKSCVIAQRRLTQEGEWTWMTHERVHARVQLFQVSIEVMRIKYTPNVSDINDHELWCFTKTQMDKQPNCSEWEISYPHGKRTLLTCNDANEGRKNINLEIKEHGNTTDGHSFNIRANTAIELMVDYAKECKLRKCWLCQQMPRSTHSPMLSPIPFSKADYEMYNWNDVGFRMADHADDCYSPTYPLEYFHNKSYDVLARFVTDEVNTKYLPQGFNLTTLLRIIYVQLYTKVEFNYRIQLTLVQTNCSNFDKSNNCAPQTYSPTVFVEAMVYIQPWFGTKTLGEVKVKIVDCKEPLQPEKSGQRDCSRYILPVAVNELINVSLCFQGAGTDERRDVGRSHCIHSVEVIVRQIPLPERVYMVCGSNAYSCVPYDNIYGTCYLAYLIPLIRKVNSSEIAALYTPLHRHKRTLTNTDKVISVLLPFYGIYVTQQELIALSKVLESHMNASVKAMLAEHKELQEVKTIALQNRMALDLLLASQGGTCKVIGTECCTYVSDATDEVMDMVHNTQEGLKLLHEEHGVGLGDFTSVFGAWGSGLVKVILVVILLIVSVCILGSCIITIIKKALRKTTEAVIQAPRIIVSNPEDGEMVCAVSRAQWRPPIVVPSPRQNILD